MPNPGPWLMRPLAHEPRPVISEQLAAPDGSKSWQWRRLDRSRGLFICRLKRFKSAGRGGRLRCKPLVHWHVYGRPVAALAAKNPGGHRTICLQSLANAAHSAACESEEGIVRSL
jgi:hypothetical protein